MARASPIRRTSATRKETAIATEAFTPEAPPRARRSLWQRIALWLLLIALLLMALVYAGASAYLWSRQESLLFRPVPLAADHVLARAPDVREVTVPVPGAHLSVLRLTRPGARGVVFYLHGNSGNLERWFAEADFYRQAGFDLVMMDYRGFGKSTGRLQNQEQLLEDVRAVWRAVAPDYVGRRIVIAGRSLGTGLAARLSSELTAAGAPADLTVLVSPYTSMVAMALRQYPWVPGFLLRYPLPTAEWLEQVGGPVLIVHGDADALIPLSHAQELKERVPRAQLVVVPGATHSSIESHDGRFHQVMGAALAAL
ncbi:MAG: alpha/beta fold hydrolase [Burkholderiales bacterium]|nr:alpha/beta fold hydrolase [Burkholderiales bacterium]